MTNELKLDRLLSGKGTQPKKRKIASLDRRKARAGWFFVLPFIIGISVVIYGVSTFFSGKGGLFSKIFAGIIAGAYQIVASNFLFPEKYEEMYNTIIATYAQMGTFDNNMMDTMKTLMRSYLFSPIPVLITQVLASIFTYGFYGLFVALGTKREADIFDNTTEDDE